MVINELEDRLSKLDGKQGEDTRLEKIDILTSLARQLWHTQPERGLRAAEQAHTLSLQAPIYKKGYAESLYGLGVSNIQLGNYQQSLEQLFESLSLHRELGNVKEEGDVLFATGSAYHFLGAYSEALDHLLKSIKIRQQVGDKKGEASSLNAIGMVQSSLGDIRESVAAYQKALTLYRGIQDEVDEAVALNNLAVAHLQMDELPAALEYGRQSLGLVQKSASKSLEAIVLCSIGEVYSKMERHETALAYFQESIQTASQIHNKYAELYAWLNTGRVYLSMQQAKTAIPVLENALSIAVETNSKKEMAECHLALTQAHKALEEYKKALVHHEEYHYCEKEIFNDEVDARIRNLSALYQTETAKKEAEIYRLKNFELEKEIQERKKLTRKLHHAARYDSLTNLPNRAFFMEHLKSAISKAEQYYEHLAVIFVDLDDFKLVNDTYGHEIGDHLLVEFSKRLKNAVRKNDIVSRFAGDEFTILINSLTHEVDVKMLAEKILNQCSDLYFLAGQKINISQSIGVSIYPKDGTDVETLLRRADMEMYKMKKQQKINPLPGGGK